MILYYATPKRNLDGIRKHGLDPKRATGKVKGVWLHTESRKPWAILHIIKRHDLQSFDDVILMQCDIPRSQLTLRGWACGQPTASLTIFKW